MGRPNQCNPCCGDITDPPEPPLIDDCDFVICVALIDENSSMGNQSSKMQKWIEAYPNRILFVLDFDSYSSNYDNNYGQEFKDWPYSMSLFLETGVELTRDNGSSTIANSNDPWTRIKNVIATKSAEIQNVFNNIASQVSVFVDNTGSLGASAVRATKEKLITDFKADGYSERGSVDNSSEDFICPFVQDKCCTNPSAADLMDLCSSVNGFNGSVCDPTQLFILDDDIDNVRYLVREYCDGFFDSGDYANVCPNCVSEDTEDAYQYNRFTVAAFNATGDNVEGIGYTKTIEYRDPGEAWETLDELEADKVAEYLANGLTGQADELDLRLHNVVLGGGLPTGENIWSTSDPEDTCTHNFLTANQGSADPCTDFERQVSGSCIFDVFRRQFRIKIDLIDYPLSATSKTFKLYEIKYQDLTDSPECNIDCKREGVESTTGSLVDSVEPNIRRVSNNTSSQRVFNLNLYYSKDPTTGKIQQYFYPYTIDNIVSDVVAQKSFDYVEGKNYGYTAFLSSKSITPEDYGPIHLTVSRVKLNFGDDDGSYIGDSPGPTEIIARIPIADFSTYASGGEYFAQSFANNCSIAITTRLPGTSDGFGEVNPERALYVAVGHFEEGRDFNAEIFEATDGKVWLFRIDDPEDITPLVEGAVETGNLTLEQTFQRTDVPDNASMKSTHFGATGEYNRDGFGCTVSMNVQREGKGDIWALAIGTHLGEVVVYDLYEEAYISFPTASSLATATRNDDIQLQTFCDGGVYEHNDGTLDDTTWSSPISSIDISEDGKTIAFGEPLYRQSPNSLRERSITRGVLTKDFYDATGEENILVGSMYEENHSRFIMGRARVFQFGYLRNNNNTGFIEGYFEVFPYFGSTDPPGPSRDYVEDLNQEDGRYWNEWLPALYGEQSAEFYKEGNPIEGEPVINYATRVRIRSKGANPITAEEIWVPLFGMDVALDSTGRTLAIGAPWQDDPQYINRKHSSSLYEPGYGINIPLNQRQGEESVIPIGMVHTWDLTLRRSTFFDFEGRAVDLDVSSHEYINPDLENPFNLSQQHFNRVTILEEGQSSYAYTNTSSRQLVSAENLTWKGPYNPWFNYNDVQFQADRGISSTVGHNILYGHPPYYKIFSSDIQSPTPSFFGASVNFSKRCTLFRDFGAKNETFNFLVVGSPRLVVPSSLGGRIAGAKRVYKRVENFLSPDARRTGVLKSTWVYVNENGLFSYSGNYLNEGNQVKVGGYAADVRYKTLFYNANKNLNNYDIVNEGIGYGIKLVYNGDRTRGGGGSSTGYEDFYSALLIESEDFIKYGPNQITGSVEGSRFVMYPGQSLILPLCGNLKIEPLGTKTWGSSDGIFFEATGRNLEFSDDLSQRVRYPSFLDLTAISQDTLGENDSTFRLYVINIGYRGQIGPLPF